MQLQTLAGNGDCPFGYHVYPDSTINAVNPCFLSLVSGSQALFFILFGTYQIVSLIRETRVPPNFKFQAGLKSIPQRHLVHISNIGLQGILLFLLISLGQNNNTTIVTIRSLYANLAFVLCVSLPLNYIHYFKSTCTLASQVFYYLVQLLLFGFQIAQKYTHPDTQDYNVLKGQNQSMIELLLLANSIVIFIYDSFLYKPAPQLLELYRENDWFVPVNIFNELTFTWMNELITETYKNKKIKDPHNMPLPPINLNMRDVSRRLQAVWENEKWHGRKSLFKSIFLAFWKTLLIGVGFELSQIFLKVIEPQLFRLFIQCFNTDIESKFPAIHGLFLALSLLITQMLQVIFQNQFYMFIFEAGLGIRGALTAMVYQKSLRLSLSTREERSSGDVLNLTSVDIMRIQRFFENAQEILGAPTQITIVLISLYFLLGKATIGGLAVMAIMIPINAYLSRKIKSLYKAQMKYKDTRIRTLTEMLNSIKSIKLYAWEEPMLKKLDHVRNGLELENFKKIAIFSNFIYFAWNCVPLMVTCSTFAIFAMISDIPLSPEIVFPSLTLFNLLNSAIYSIPSLVNNIIETGVSMNRLKDFLLSEELDDTFIEVIDTPNQGEPIVEIKNATFLWRSVKSLQQEHEGHDEENTIGATQIALKNINNLQIETGSLTCILGRVGSGKSTMLRAMLGQLPCISSSEELLPPKLIIRSRNIAYCPQEPWIMNNSVKENILFGHRYDEPYYKATLKACQLMPDLEILPDGDEVLVGEKGISLSGGQKARLSLARAVYARADLYLLDDILSAVDAEVSKNIVEKVLDRNTGLLRNKTVILTTNAVSVLKHSQQIYALENGEIVEFGQYDMVMEGPDSSRIKNLIKEFDYTGKQPQSGHTDPKANTDDQQANKSVDNKETLEFPEVSSDVADSVKSFQADERLELLQVSSRRASMATIKPRPIFEMGSDSAAKAAQQEEKREVGRIKPAIYLAYIKACGLTGVFLFFLFMIATRVFDLVENFWLKHWSEKNQSSGTNDNFWFYVGVYALIGILSAAFNNLRSIVMLLYCSIRGSRKLHDSMALAVIRCPMSFFETTPIGRVINRFSSDIESVDSSLQYIFSFFFSSILNYMVTIILVGYNMPLFFVFNMLLLIVYLYYQAYYITLSRELKRLVSVSYSPILSLISETLVGHSVINAYQQAARFNYFHYESVQFNIDCAFNFRSTNRWLSVRLQNIGALTVFIAALLTLSTINTDKKLSAGMVGLLMSYALQVTDSLTWIVRMTVQIETNIVSVERIVEYCKLPPEADAIIEGCRPEKNWPANGLVEFKNYSTKYRANLDPVLKDINITIKPKEKIGIVGRTGAGKSTLSLALFRMLEPTEGSIFIDGVDISKIGLTDLRSNLAIIPQDAQAFEGTIRTNLDPFNQYTDQELWKAIELSHLRSHLEKISASSAADDAEERLSTEATVTDGSDLLNIKIQGNGSNLSVGQRQLLCLSRALLNKSKILVLDEATAAVDLETDKIIQDTIRSEFKERTIMTIAHRIDTVLGYDKIIVLDRGQVKEFDTPKNLLQDKDSMFYSLCEKGGYLNSS